MKSIYWNITKDIDWSTERHLYFNKYHKDAYDYAADYLYHPLNRILPNINFYIKMIIEDDTNY